MDKQQMDVRVDQGKQCSRFSLIVGETAPKADDGQSLGDRYRIRKEELLKLITQGFVNASTRNLSSDSQRHLKSSHQISRRE